MSYRLSALAEQDLDEIWSHVAQDASPDTADRLIDTIIDRFELLAEQPRMGRLRPEFGEGIRSFTVENHVIYYGQAHDHDAHQRDMVMRGALAMGLDQERTVHHFLLYDDGGAIDVAVKEASDHTNLHAIREHLQQIAGLFKAGDFGKPALTHA